jgi:protein-S-isoprenylcysteine O-methyltransferase Ste14
MTKGVYAFIRHPIYTGIYIFIFGGLLASIPRVNWFLITIGLTAVTFIMSLLPIIAARETEFLVRRFGEDFVRYRNQVHPFFPLRKIREDG